MANDHDVTVVRTTHQVVKEMKAPEIHLPQRFATRGTGHLINDTFI